MPQHRIEAGALATIGIRDISSSVQVAAEKPTGFSDKIMLQTSRLLEGADWRNAHREGHPSVGAERNSFTNVSSSRTPTSDTAQ